MTAAVMALGIALAIRAVLQHRVAHHSTWMIRAYARGKARGRKSSSCSPFRSRFTPISLPFRFRFTPISLVYGEPSFFIRDVLITLS
jgi:hypothetical protein